MESTTRDARTADGPRLALHERAPVGAEEAVPVVHGATYPGGVVFDLPVPGFAVGGHRDRRRTARRPARRLFAATGATPSA